MIEKGLQADAAGEFPDVMNFEVLLVGALDQVLHPHFLLAQGMKIIHGGQPETLRQFVIVLPSILILFQKNFFIHPEGSFCVPTVQHSNKGLEKMLMH